MAGDSNVSDDVMEAYARWIMKQVNDAGLNGVDIDYEGWNETNIFRLVKILGQYWGPMGQNPDMLLIVDYFSAQPGSDCEPLRLLRAASLFRPDRRTPPLVQIPD